MGGALPPALLCVALGLALSFAERRALPTGLALLIVAAVSTAWLPISADRSDLVFVGCWIVAVLVAALVHLPRPLGVGPAGLAGLLSGGLAGAAVATAGAPTDLLIALPCALLCLPGRWLVARRLGIVVKVASSWVIAVALLAAALSTVPTPGYEPDHMQ